MLKKSGNNLKLHYGDSLDYQFSPKDYEFISDDYVIITFKKNIDDEEPIMQFYVRPDVINNVAYFHIDPSTMSDKFPVGKYYYDIHVQNQLVKWSLIDPSKLIITEVVHK